MSSKENHLPKQTKPDSAQILDTMEGKQPLELLGLCLHSGREQLPAGILSSWMGWTLLQDTNSKCVVTLHMHWCTHTGIWWGLDSAMDTPTPASYTIPALKTWGWLLIRGSKSSSVECSLDHCATLLCNSSIPQNLTISILLDCP